MTAELALLWLICGGMAFVIFCLTVGWWLANLFYGREPGGRK